jgi:hypothetical protein
MPLLALLALSPPGCDLENAVSRRTYEDVFLQEPASQVDALWVIDDSVSMAANQARVAESLTGFIQALVETHIDFHLAVVTTDMDPDNPDAGILLGDPPFLTPEDDYLALFQERVQVGTGGSGKEKGLAAALAALRAPSTIADGFLREEAVTALFFVSDEEDCSDGGALADEPEDACYSLYDQLLPVEDLLADLQAVKGDPALLRASALVGLADDACESTWQGARYQAVAEATGGVVGDICGADFSGVMDALGLSVAGLRTAFQLTWAPRLETLEVGVDEVAIPEDPVDGWTYDEATGQLRFEGAYVPPRGATVSVSYEIAGRLEGG